MKPLVVDLFTGLHGWSEGFMAAGYRARGYDLEDMCAKFGEAQPAGDFELVLKNVLEMHGSEIADADFIVGSSPCQDFSYRATPWTRARSLTGPFGGLQLFHAQFRLQREASEAKGRYIPMVVENVQGAQKWVGKAAGHYGSYCLWGDVPDALPKPLKSGVKVGGLDWKHPDDPRHRPGQAFNPGAQGREVQESTKVKGFRFDGSGGSFQTASVQQAVVQRPAVSACGERWFNDGPRTPGSLASSSSKSDKRKRASAIIAKIPFTLAYYIAAIT